MLAPRFPMIVQQGFCLDLDVAEEMIAERGEIDVEVGDVVEREHEAELAEALEAGKLIGADIEHGALAHLEGEVVGKGAVLLHELDELGEEIVVAQRLGREIAEHALEPRARSPDGATAARTSPASHCRCAA